MELQDIRTNVRAMVGMDTEDGLLTDATLDVIINASIREVANQRDWDWYQDSVSVSHSGALNSPNLSLITYRKVVSVYDTTHDRLLQPVTTNTALRRDSNDFGTPQWWYIDQNMLKIRPATNTTNTFVVRVLQDEPTLVNDTDEPLVPDYAIDLVIYGAATKIAARLDNSSQYQILAQEYKRVYGSLVDDARRSTASPQIDSRRDW